MMQHVVHRLADYSASVVRRVWWPRTEVVVWNAQRTVTITWSGGHR